MVLEVWPTSLPQAFMVFGYGEATPEKNIITDDYNVGPPIYRRRTTSAPSNFGGQMFMTTAEWEELSTFFHGTLYDGVMRFLFPPQGTSSAARYWISRFISPPSRQRSDADDGWFVTLAMEKLGLGQIFISPPAFSSSSVFYAPTILTGPSLFIPLVTGTQSFYSPEMITEPFLVPSLITDLDTFYGPSVSQVDNLVVGSETFNTWGLNQASVAQNTTTAPDGNTTADTVTMTGSGGTAINSAGAFTAAGSTAYTASIYGKPDTVNWIHIQLSDGVADAFGAHFNVSTGAVGTTLTFGTGSLSSKSLAIDANGFYRCQVTGSFSSSNPDTKFMFRATPADNTNPVNGNSAIFWGAQAEIGSVATSYIET